MEDGYLALVKNLPHRYDHLSGRRMRVLRTCVLRKMCVSLLWVISPCSEDRCYVFSGRGIMIHFHFKITPEWQGCILCYFWCVQSHCFIKVRFLLFSKRWILLNLTPFYSGGVCLPCCAVLELLIPEMERADNSLMGWRTSSFCCWNGHITASIFHKGEVVLVVKYLWRNGVFKCTFYQRASVTLFSLKN